jgi:aspartate-semialdehyde dehydrogenase
MVITPLHYQSTISNVLLFQHTTHYGTGVKAVQQLENEYAGIQGEMAYKYPIHRKRNPQCDSFEENVVILKRK